MALPKIGRPQLRLTSEYFVIILIVFIFLFIYVTSVQKSPRGGTFVLERVALGTGKGAEPPPFLQTRSGKRLTQTVFFVPLLRLLVTGIIFVIVVLHRWDP